MDLNEALEYVSVHDPFELERAWVAGSTATVPKDTCPHPPGWWGVSSDSAGGIIAYFATEAEACWYRLALVNRLLNVGGRTPEKEAMR